VTIKSLEDVVKLGNADDIIKHIENGKTLLTWKLTDAGLKAIKATTALKIATKRTVDATPDYSGPVLDTAAKQLNEAETLTPMKVELIDGVLKEIEPQSDEETFKQCIATINELYAKNYRAPTVSATDLADMQFALDQANKAISAISIYFDDHQKISITTGLGMLENLLKQLQPQP
jgi:carbamoylphosphate synthase large subunit